MGTTAKFLIFSITLALKILSASKAHPGGHHLHVRPYYVHMPTSPRFLIRAVKPSIRRGCVDQVDPAYLGKQPLPALLRVPSVVTRHLVPTAA